MAVKINDGRANDPEYWGELVERQRAMVATERSDSLRRMHEVVNGGSCVAGQIAAYYTIQEGGVRLATQINCRGCPWCRANLNADAESGLYRTGIAPYPSVHEWPSHPRDPLAELRGSRPLLCITWGMQQERRDLLPDLLAKLAARGMNIIGGPGLDVATAQVVQRAARAHAVINDYDGYLAEFSMMPIVWVLAEGTQSLDDAVARRLLAGDLTYLIQSRDLPDPERPGHRFEDLNPAIPLGVALGEL